VHPGWDIPLNAVCLSFLITCLLSLINLGSAVAFNAIVSLTVSAILSSYIISISCVAYRKLLGQRLPPARWSLGSPRVGLACNVVAVVFMVVIWVFAFFPLAPQVDAATMNWSSTMYDGIVVFALGYYVVHGRFVYEGPVVSVKSEYDE